SERDRVELRYTTDGSPPAAGSALAKGPIRVSATTTINARAFRDGKPVSPVATRTFAKVKPRTADKSEGLSEGLTYEYFEGNWHKMPDFDKLKPVRIGAIGRFDLAPHSKPELYGFRFRGFIRVPKDGVYTFHLSSDDGSRLFIGDKVLIDNDGLHEMIEKSGQVALAAGPHLITVEFFQCTGGVGLDVQYEGPGITKRRIPADVLLSRSGS